jgi:LuxR family maltose regulon positive regulatory protein
MRADYLVMARVLLAEREGRAAGRLLERLLPLLERAGLAGELIESSLLQALVFHGAGELPRALQALARAVALAERTGYVQAFVEDGPALLPLLAELETRGAATAFVRELRALAGKAASTAPSSSAGTPQLVEPLSSREEEVLRLTAAGLSAPEIADELVIAVGTVRAHLKSIYGKLEVHNRVQAAEAARRLGLL